MPQRHGRTLRPDSDRPTLDKDFGAGRARSLVSLSTLRPYFATTFATRLVEVRSTRLRSARGLTTSLVSQPWFLSPGASALVRRHCRLHERSGAPVARHCLSLRRKAGKERQSLSRWGRYHDGWTAACGAAGASAPCQAYRPGFRPQQGRRCRSMEADIAARAELRAAIDAQRGRGYASHGRRLPGHQAGEIRLAMAHSW